MDPAERFGVTGDQEHPHHCRVHHPRHSNRSSVDVCVSVRTSVLDWSSTRSSRDSRSTPSLDVQGTEANSFIKCGTSPDSQVGTLCTDTSSCRLPRKTSLIVYAYRHKFLFSAAVKNLTPFVCSYRITPGREEADAPTEGPGEQPHLDWFIGEQVPTNHLLRNDHSHPAPVVGGDRLSSWGR